MKTETKARIKNYYDKRSAYRTMITLCLVIKHNNYSISRDILKIIYNLLCQQVKFVNIMRLKPKTRHLTMLQPFHYKGTETVTIKRIRVARADHRNPGCRYRYRVKLFVGGFSDKFIRWIKDIENSCEFTLGKSLKSIYNEKT